MDLKETYNKIAEEWNLGHRSDDWWQEGTDKFLSLCKPAPSILDVGCGQGWKSKYLIKKGIKLLGIDFSEKMIEIARREAPGERFLVINIEDLDNLKESFDGIYAQAVLLHFHKKEIPEILDILKRRLNPGGYLYVAVKELAPGGREEEEVPVPLDKKYRRFFSFFTLEEMEDCFKNAGFEVSYKKVVPGEGVNWIQIIGKNKGEL